MAIIKIVARSPIRSIRKFWYFIIYTECPVCGHDDEVRERRYDPKPERYEDRHKFNERYDWCQD